MWDYINKISSLEGKASARVAINLCQEYGFKEVAMRLEKPTYGGFIGLNASSFFVSDSKKLSIWAKVKDDDRLRDDFIKFFYNEDDGSACEKVRRWDAAVDEQCQRLTEGIPNQLKQKIHPWINRISLEYLSYSRRQEALFGVSRYFLMDIFTRGDWTESGRLDERKLAQRLLEDERLTVLQRYRIACAYCLHVHISQLWEKLTQEEKQFTSGDGKRGLSEETHRLVLLWSRYMNANQKKKVTRRAKYLRTAISQTVSDGNRAALMVCWKELQEDTRQKMIIYLALASLRQLQNVQLYYNQLVSYQLSEKQSADSIKYFNLPSYYSELMFFFLSQADEEQQLKFFKTAFQRKYCNQYDFCYKSVLECFLDWPHQDDFLPTINRLWGIIPKAKYGRCLLALARKYSLNHIKANCDYDYRSLLRASWEETPEEYKHYVFRNTKENFGPELLLQLSARSPFQEKDEAIFKQIFRDQPQQRRRAMMHSEEGRYMCYCFMQKEKWSFLNGLLEECLLQEEIPDFKKRFIQSDNIFSDCLNALKENGGKLVEDLLDWSLESEAEKTRCKDEFKDALISGITCEFQCKYLLSEGKFADVERVINFCLSSDEKKEQFKRHFGHHACGDLLRDYTRDSWSEDCVWEKMDTIIAWSVDTEEKIRDFKKDLFSRESPSMINSCSWSCLIHDQLVFPYRVEAVWEKVERFYQWFDLSPEEIKQLKRDTLFRPELIHYIGNMLHHFTEFVAPLRWCLTDEGMVIDFKKEVEVYCTDDFRQTGEMKKGQLDQLMSELLDGFRKEVQDKTGREGVGEKRSVGIEEESISPGKRCK